MNFFPPNTLLSGLLPELQQLVRQACIDLVVGLPITEEEAAWLVFVRHQIGCSSFDVEKKMCTKIMLIKGELYRENSVYLSEIKQETAERETSITAKIEPGNENGFDEMCKLYITRCSLLPKLSLLDIGSSATLLARRLGLGIGAFLGTDTSLGNELVRFISGVNKILASCPVLFCLYMEWEPEKESKDIERIISYAVLTSLYPLKKGFIRGPSPDRSTLNRYRLNISDSPM